MSEPREAGTVRSISASEYHAIKALSAGMIWTMESECPFKAWLDSPWNPNREPVNTAHFDIGTAAHLAVLEPLRFAERTLVIPEDVLDKGGNYGTAEARRMRDEAHAAGITPLKPPELAVVQGISYAVKLHDTASKLFSKGDYEASLTWKWGGVACKCRPDFLSADRTYMLDLKSTTTANPKVVGRKAFNEGWFVRAAWYVAGVKAVFDVLPDKYLFVIVEKDAPHLVEVYELDDRALIYGENIVMRTLNRAGDCLQSGKWPSYGDGGITKLSLPRWSEFELADRDEAVAA